MIKEITTIMQRLYIFLLLLIIITSCKQQAIIPEMVFVKGGSFQMGQENVRISLNPLKLGAQPVHEVVLQGFYIGKYEVTNAEYVLFLNDKLAYQDKFENWIDFTVSRCKLDTTKVRFEVAQKFERCPVVGVTWYGADNYCRWLSVKTGQHYRLPTEAEWEYAAKDKGKHYMYAGSNDLDEVAWYKENTRKIQPVGTKQPNALGLYDMTGNAAEWCFDWFDEVFYIQSKRINPINYVPSSYKCIRGGAWYSNAKRSRVSQRNSSLPLWGSESQGFRIVREK